MCGWLVGNWFILLFLEEYLCLFDISSVAVHVKGVSWGQSKRVDTGGCTTIIR